MMLHRQAWSASQLVPPAGRRRGAALLEMAFVAVIFLMLLFGIMEYCRFTFYRQLVTNAAREGARFAVVNTLTGNVETETLARIKTFMAGVDGKMKNYAAEVYKSDSAGNKTGPVADAGFGEYVCVSIHLDYEPILPSFLFMNQTIKLDFKSMMYSEAN